MTKLSDTQRVILSAASQHELGLAPAPKSLPAAARNAVFRSLIKANLLTEMNAPREHVGLGWRQDEDETWIVARITDEGLRAIGIDPNEGDAEAATAPAEPPQLVPQDDNATAAEPAQDAPQAALDGTPAQAASTLRRTNLRDTAAAVLAAWDAVPDREGDVATALATPVEALRQTLTKSARTPREPGAPRPPRQGTKQEAVLTMLRRPEGATVAQIAEATGWASHTVRGFFAGLKKKGHAVEVRERIRQVGPNAQGARGSHSIYQLASHAG